MEEKECVKLLLKSHEKIVFEATDDIVLNISNDMNVYFNYTHMTKPWIIGNILKDDAKELVRKIMEGDTYALNMIRKCSYSELVKRYGDTTSTKVFTLDDYKMYIVNRYLDDCAD